MPSTAFWKAPMIAATATVYVGGQTLRLAMIGLVIGVGASWLVARGISALLFGVTAGDPRTFVGMIAILAMVALAAGYLPARRSSRIEPMVALRAE